MSAETTVIAGTRPELIKVAPLVRELDRRGLPRRLVLTGQHGSVLEPLLAHFEILPDVRLPAVRRGASLNELFTHVVTHVEPLVASSSGPVVVQGDTTSAAAAALAAFNGRSPVVHLEAGLRTGDLGSPFPEEGNRKLIGQLATLHLAPTSRAQQALLREGVDPASVVVTGNTVVDALLHSVRNRRLQPSSTGSHVLVTAHRRESWGEGIRAIGEAVRRIAQDRAEVEFLWVVHPNPAVRADVVDVLQGQPNVHLTEPLDYPAMVNALADCRLVLTDSGGLQEEAPSLGKPVLVTRDKTERVEAVEAGCARLVGTCARTIEQEVTALLDDPLHYRAMSEVANPYGDGTAAVQAVDRMVATFALTSAQGHRLAMV